MSKFKEYLKDLQGMERITLVLDLLVDGKITKEQAVVLIANDKQIKDPAPKVDPYYNPTWVGGVTTSPYTAGGILTRSDNPYVTYSTSTSTDA